MPKAKKQIDKEAMFNKIMPSVTISQDSEPDEEAAKPAPIPAYVQAASSPSDAPALGAPQTSIGAKRSVIPTNKQVQLSQPEPTALVNLMEQMVADRLDAAIEKFHCCRCDKCKKDVAAISLNRLKPRYVVADQSAKLAGERQTSSEVTTAIVQAILIVKSHPRH